MPLFRRKKKSEKKKKEENVDQWFTAKNSQHRIEFLSKTIELDEKYEVS